MMVGKLVVSDQSGSSLALEELVPQHNLYRRLKQVLDLTFLYAAVEPYYGSCGQQSIDPVVFFKLLLVGHLENLTSDRAIIERASSAWTSSIFWTIRLESPFLGTAPFPAPANAYPNRCLKLASNGSCLSVYKPEW